MDDIIRISGNNPKKCMMCGKCLATCPLDMDVSPPKVAKYLSQNKLDALLSSKTIWNCLSCLNCVEKCPRGVEPASLVEALRLTLIRKQGEPFLSHEEIAKMNTDEIPQQLIVAATRKYNR